MKNRRNLRQNVSTSTKQKQTLVYASYGIALALLVSGGVFFYLNLGNSSEGRAANAFNFTIKKGLWESDSIWNDGVAPDASKVKASIEIYSYVTRAGSLSFKKGGEKTLTVIDTLNILGDLILGKENKIRVAEEGVLMVGGSIFTDKKNSIENEGVIIVSDNLAFDEERQNTYKAEQGQLYVLRDDKASTPLSQYKQGLPSLKEQHPKLYRLVELEQSALTSFDVDMINAKVLINWSTDESLLGENFTIERSIDGINFQAVTTESNPERTSTEGMYSAIDANPLSGVSFYRLKHTDPNGKQEFFDVAAVRNDNYEDNQLISNILVSPNPFNNYFKVEFKMAQAGEVELSVKNLEGKTLATLKSDVTDGVNQINYEDQLDLEPGTYLLSLKTNGYQSNNLRLTKLGTIESEIVSK